MNIRVLWIVGFGLCMAGCAEKEQVTPPQDEATQAAARPVESPPAEAPATDMEFVDEAFLAHMHEHADQLDTLNFALADGELEGAQTPAYWLSRHETVSGVPTEWQPFLIAMRDEAKAVEAATDLETARAAAKRITEQCQGCHAAAGLLGD